VLAQAHPLVLSLLGRDPAAERPAVEQPTDARAEVVEFGRRVLEAIDRRRTTSTRC